MSTTDSFDTTSTRPYLIRALYEWCTDNGLTPYVAVRVDETVQVPREYVKDGEIVLNVSMDATSALKLGNDFIEFKARFGGITRDIQVPVDHVVAIYARENGQGMAFPMPTGAGGEDAGAAQAETAGLAAPATAVPAQPRGLRLASTEAPAEAAPAPGNDGEPPEPAPPAGRPSLKRIK